MTSTSYFDWDIVFDGARGVAFLGDFLNGNGHASFRPSHVHVSCRVVQSAVSWQCCTCIGVLSLSFLSPPTWSFSYPTIGYFGIASARLVKLHDICAIPPVLGFTMCAVKPECQLRSRSGGR